MVDLERIRVPLTEFRNDMSKFIQLIETGVIVDITVHGQHKASVISVEDLERLEGLIAYLRKRALEANQKEEEGDVAKARRIRRENHEVGELVKRALRQAAEGDSTLLYKMARKYLDY